MSRTSHKWYFYLLAISAYIPKVICNFSCLYVIAWMFVLPFGTLLSISLRVLHKHATFVSSLTLSVESLLVLAFVQQYSGIRIFHCMWHPSSVLRAFRAFPFSLDVSCFLFLQITQREGVMIINFDMKSLTLMNAYNHDTHCGLTLQKTQSHCSLLIWRTFINFL